VQATNDLRRYGVLGSLKNMAYRIQSIGGSMALLVRVKLSPAQQEMARQGVSPNDFGFSEEFKDLIASFKPYSEVHFDGVYMVLTMGST
jgi:hypothetical protein